MGSGLNVSVADAVPPQLTARRGERGVVIVEIAGDWLGRTALPDLGPVDKELGGGGVSAMEFEAKQLGRWDSALMARILAIDDLCAKANVELRAKTLPDGLAKLIALAEAVPEKTDAARPDVKRTFLQRVGESGLDVWNGATAMLSFMGESVLAFVQMLRGRAQFRWSDTWLVIQQCGPEALGIVALINFLIGLILAFVGATELSQFGASIYTADLVAIATVREMACIMTGIIMCGRTGAAFAAQLGTMKVNQEIEAFQTFGISPFEFLVLPRMLALILMMPLLCVFADLISIAGGFLASTLMLDITPALYLHRTVEAISLVGFLLGVCKGGFFGVLVALTGCLRGMQCGTNAAAVGEATTSAVVTGITWIIASDGIFAVICNALNI
ncbi:MAG: ABC transporter permease [Steroidobacteraceae bacterium]|jgi:phospholipid/cholesterol/gamma-HCH transport system permease protein